MNNKYNMRSLKSKQKARDRATMLQEKLCRELANSLFRTDKEIIGLTFIAHKAEVSKGLSGMKRNKAHGISIWKRNKRSKK